MPNRNYLAGRRFEYECKKLWEKSGWTVMRTAGSHGVADLIALGTFRPPQLIQCKIVRTLAEADRLWKKLKKLYKPLNGVQQLVVIKVKGDKTPIIYYL